MSKAIRVLIADDQDMLRSGLSVFIQTCADLLLVGEARDGSEAVKCCQTLQPDVILMDLLMPGMDGIAAIRSIHHDYPSIHIVVLTSFIDEKLVSGAISAGATSYLLKNVSVDALAEAIRDAHSGKATLAREAAQTLVQAAQRPTFSLTKREHEVLNLMAKGMNNAQIAKELIIGISTAKKHVSNVLRKLNTSSRTQAVALAVRHKLVTD